MPYKVFLSREFEREFSKLDNKLKKRIVEKLKDIAEDPEAFGKPLRYGLKGLWSCRVGKYRIIYMIKKDSKTINVITVKHRKKVY